MKNPIASIIDHTNIHPQATEDSIIHSCTEARAYGFRGVCVLPAWVKVVARELRGTSIKTIALIDSPLGLSSHEERLATCKQAVDDGADELDIVLNVVDLKYDRLEKITTDLTPLCALAPTKIIIGSGYLIDEEIVAACKLAGQAGAFCVKTATYKDPLEQRDMLEKAHHIRLMKKTAPQLKIKASGSIKLYSDVLLMLESGADIIGTSASVSILTE